MICLKVRMVFKECNVRLRILCYMDFFLLLFILYCFKILTGSNKGGFSNMLNYKIISKTRDKRGMTQESLSKKTGIRQEIISKLENGK